MQSSRYSIAPTAEDLENALESWRWIGIGGKTPIFVSAFGDIFLEDPAGIWFLDTLEGKLKPTHATRKQLYDALSTAEGRNHYLFAGFVDLAVQDGKHLGVDQCYDFKLHPVVGGAIDYENIETVSFVVAVHIRGQLHQQTRNLPAGTPIGGFVLEEEAGKPWWKLW